MIYKFYFKFYGTLTYFKEYTCIATFESKISFRFKYKNYNNSVIIIQLILIILKPIMFILIKVYNLWYEV